MSTRKTLKTYVLLLLCFSVTLHAQQKQTKPLRGKALYKAAQIYDSRKNGGKPLSPTDMAAERQKLLFEQIKNPKTGKVPDQIREKELQFSKTTEKDNQQKTILPSKSEDKNTTFSYWENRGPYNVGGRTRALAIDITNENIILAGGVSGGLWRSEDEGTSWQKVTRFDQSPSITTIVQDPRPGKNNIWYYGTGELAGNSAVANDREDINGTPFLGTGIYKSTDGGRSFQLLEATDDGDIQEASAFDYVNKLTIHPDTGTLFAATHLGIFLSRDEGTSFISTLPNTLESNLFSSVGVAPIGKVYATMASDANPNSGLFVSDDDGTTWENLEIPNFNFTSNRTLIAFDQNNPSWVYFMGDDTGSSRFLMRYDSRLPNPEEAFVRLNLPVNSDVFGVIFRGSFTMTLNVHPKYSNIMFVGGTNLVKSVTGFTDPDEEYEIIGGINLQSMEEQTLDLITVDNYTNHHADQHDLIFFPSNPNKALSANDGGVFITEDILREEENNVGETVQWTSLNNGYITTQPYAVSFDHTTTSTDLLAGFQDNGTWFTNSSDPTAPWIQDLGADGFYSAITDQGMTRYVSFQRGIIFRLNFNEQGDYLGFDFVTTGTGPNGPFLTLLELDPFDNNIMYYRTQTGFAIHRNLDLIGSNGDSVELIREPDDFVEEENITTIGVSKYPIPHRVYIGSNNGKIYRIDNALSPRFRTMTEVYVDKGLPANGYVNDISVDPSNPDRVIAVFSNYGIPSVFFTDDGGDTWQDISGNLEENPDGSGNGSSARCADFFGSGNTPSDQRVQNIYVGTSTGIYRTSTINGQNTRWGIEPLVIGNNVVDELDIRKDGFIAAAVHGNGLYSARFPVTRELPEFDLEITQSFEDTLVNRNIGSFIIPVNDLIVSRNGNPISFEVQVTNTDIITTATVENDFLIVVNDTAEIGSSEIDLIVKSGQEQLILTIGMEYFDGDQVLQNQNSEAIGFHVPSVARSPEENDFLIAADDFDVPQGQAWEIDRIVAHGITQGDVSDFLILLDIYSDDNGKPGESILSGIELLRNTKGVIDFRTSSNLGTLQAGKYWISMRGDGDISEGTNLWSWQSEPNNNGLESQYLAPKGLVDKSNPIEAWTPVSEVFKTSGPLDQKFTIYGSIIDAPDSDAKDSDEIIREKLELSIYPNPSTASFIIPLQDFEDSKGVILKVMDVTGRIIFQDIVGSSIDRYIWDATEQESGLYVISVDDGNQKFTLRAIKN